MDYSVRNDEVAAQMSCGDHDTSSCMSTYRSHVNEVALSNN